MDLAKDPHLQIPKPKFGKPSEAITQQWAEWRRDTRSVHALFAEMRNLNRDELIKPILRTDPLKLAEALYAATNRTFKGSPEVLAEAARRYLLRLDGGPVNKHGMTTWDQVIHQNYED